MLVIVLVLPNNIIPNSAIILLSQGPLFVNKQLKRAVKRRLENRQSSGSSTVGPPAAKRPAGALAENPLFGDSDVESPTSAGHTKRSLLKVRKYTN
jgi:hypothetical protein